MRRVLNLKYLCIKREGERKKVALVPVKASSFSFIIRIPKTAQFNRKEKELPSEDRGFLMRLFANLASLQRRTNTRVRVCDKGT